MQPDYDLLIIGGGMVGASLVQALRSLPLRVAVVEASAPGAAHPSFDARGIALAQGSKRIFEGLGLWQALQGEGVTAITRIHVSDRGRFGSTRLSARDEGVEALGYVTEANVLGRVLEKALAEADNTTVLRPARLTGIGTRKEGVSARIDHDGEVLPLSAKLIVAADGGRSAVRALLGEKVLHHGYGQTAVIAYVTTDRPHGGWAYERFTNTGPLALLPCQGARGTAEAAAGDHRWSVVYSVRDEEVEEILALPDEQFLVRLQERFGHRAGRFLSASPRQAYPLVLNFLRDHVRPRVVFIGNAAHAIHPVGGQGFNLGLRDVAALAEVLADAVHRGEDVGARAVLDRYAKWRQPDYLRTLAFTDGLARTFSSSFPPLALARDLALLGMDLLPGAKRLFAAQAMGLLGKQPRLARGLAI
ncbi:MAG: 2-octaprenyl-6-methoxyphenyl hydroxylase [Thiohalomonadaceae bacterium]